MHDLKSVAKGLLTILFLAGCVSKHYPADQGKIKYANRNSPGSKLEVKSLLSPKEMNLIYFYADW